MLGGRTRAKEPRFPGRARRSADVCTLFARSVDTWISNHCLSESRHRDRVALAHGVQAPNALSVNPTTCEAGNANLVTRGDAWCTCALLVAKVQCNDAWTFSTASSASTTSIVG